MDNEQFYMIPLENYFSISFCSSIKNYFGTESDLEAFVKALRDIKHGDEFIKAYSKFCAGDTDLLYSVGYTKRHLAEPVKMISSKTVEIKDTIHKFQNIHDCTYTHRVGSGTVKQAVFRHEEQFYHAIKPELHDVYLLDKFQDSKWDLLDDWFWGHPGILKMNYQTDTKPTKIYKRATHNVLISNLWLTEGVYHSEKKAFAAMDDTEHLVLRSVWEDVVGDG